MLQQTQTEKKMPDGRVDEFFRPDDETIPPEQMKARLNGTESNRAAAKGRETERSGEITSKTKTSERDSKTPYAEPKAGEDAPKKKKTGKTEGEMPEKAESPSAKTPRKKESTLPENRGKRPAYSRKGTEISPETDGKERAAKASETTSSKPSEGSENFPISPESISEDTTSSPTNTFTETDGEMSAALEELHGRAENAAEKASSLLLMENLLKATDLHNRLVAEETESLSTFKKELSEETATLKAELEAEMRELRQGLAAAMHTYSECLSMKTNGIRSTIEESLDRLEMNNKWIREGTDRLIEEDRAVILRIPALVEEEMTRAANETGGYVEEALEETVKKYTGEIEASTKFLKKQVEERKKASRFEKVTDVLMRVFCPILALGTFVLACVVTCLV